MRMAMLGRRSRLRGARPLCEESFRPGVWTWIRYGRIFWIQFFLETDSAFSAFFQAVVLGTSALPDEDGDDDHVDATQRDKGDDGEAGEVSPAPLVRCNTTAA